MNWRSVVVVARVRGKGRRKERGRCIEGSMRGREGGEEEEGAEEEKEKYKRFEKTVRECGQGRGERGGGRDDNQLQGWFAS